MSIVHLSVETRNARLDAIETQIGQSPTLRIRSGALPANTLAARAGAVLATVLLPNDWMLPAAGGSKSMSGTWADNAADAAGQAQSFDISDAAGKVHLQGDVTASGGGGFMTVDNVVFAAGQGFSVTSFVLNDNNAGS